MNINEILAVIALLTLAGTMIELAYHYKKTFKGKK